MYFIGSHRNRVARNKTIQRGYFFLAYFVKNFYRKQNPKDKITLTKMRPTLALMRTATSQTDLAGANAAVLNLQNGKLLFDDKPINANKLLELQADAAQLADIWEMV